MAKKWIKITAGIATPIILVGAGYGIYKLIQSGLLHNDNKEAQKTFDNLSDKEKEESNAAKKKYEEHVESDKKPDDIIINENDSEEVVEQKLEEQNYWKIINTLKDMFKSQNDKIVIGNKVNSDNFSGRDALSIGNIYLSGNAAYVEFDVVEKAGYIFSNYTSLMRIQLKDNDITLDNFHENIDANSDLMEFARFDANNNDYLNRMYKMAISQDYNFLCQYAKNNSMEMKLIDGGCIVLSENGVATSADMLIKLFNNEKMEYKLINVSIPSLGSLASEEDFANCEKRFEDDQDVVVVESTANIKSDLEGWQEIQSKYNKSAEAQAQAEIEEISTRNEDGKVTGMAWDEYQEKVETKKAQNAAKLASQDAAMDHTPLYSDKELSL